MTLVRKKGIISKKWLSFLAVGALVLGLLAWRSLSRLFWQLVFAGLLSAMALPLCTRLEKKLSRPWASAGAVGVLVVVGLGVIGLLIPHVIAQATLFLSEAPRLMSQLKDLWQRLARSDHLAAMGLDANAPEQWIFALGQWINGSLPGLISGLGAGVDAVSRAFLSPVLAYYFLKDREMFGYRLSLWIPLQYRKRVLTAFQEMRREAGGYLRGQGLISLAVAALTALGLLLVGIPAWLALGLLMGLCEWIPYLGPLLGGIPIALFALPMGWGALLWGLGVTVAVQQIEGFFLSPRLMAGATGLHPVSVVLLLSAGGLLAGLAGMMAALPLFVCVRGALRVLYETWE